VAQNTRLKLESTSQGHGSRECTYHPHQGPGEFEADRGPRHGSRECTVEQRRFSAAVLSSWFGREAEEAKADRGPRHKQLQLQRRGRSTTATPPGLRVHPSSPPAAAPRLQPDRDRGARRKEDGAREQLTARPPAAAGCSECVEVGSNDRAVDIVGFSFR
jgi:hypothetical protein